MQAREEENAEEGFLSNAQIFKDSRMYGVTTESAMTTSAVAVLILPNTTLAIMMTMMMTNMD